MNQWRIQDFPEGGAPIPKLGLFCKFFAENCMEMKEFGPRGETRPCRPLDPPMYLVLHTPNGNSNANTSYEPPSFQLNRCFFQ